MPSIPLIGCIPGFIQQVKKNVDQNEQCDTLIVPPFMSILSCYLFSLGSILKASSVATSKDMGVLVISEFNL